MIKMAIPWVGWLWAPATLAVVVLIGLLVHRIFFGVFSRIAKRTSSGIYASLVRHSRKPAGLIFPLIGVILSMPLLHLPPQILDAVNHILALAIIASFGWLAVALTEILSDVISAKYDVGVRDNLTARRVQT